jgi:hypothetical protein
VTRRISGIAPDSCGLVTGDHIGTQAKLRSLKVPILVADWLVVVANCVLRDIDRGFAEIFRRARLGRATARTPSSSSSTRRSRSTPTISLGR